MRIGFVAAVLVSCMLVGCTEGDSDREELRLRRPRASPTSETTTVIGLVGTMSGAESWRGTDAFEGAHFGVQALNRNIDPSHPRFELVTLDDRGDAGRAAALVAELAVNPRTAGVIYAGPTRGLPPAQAALADAGVPGLLCYGDLYSARLLRSHLFQMSPPYLWQARSIASYLLSDRRYRTVGALVAQSLDGQTAARSLRSAFAEAGRGRLVVERYSPADLDFRPALARLRARRVSAVVVQASPRGFDEALSAVREMGASYRTTATARAGGRGKRPWQPQVVGLDAAIHSSERTPSAGTVAADSYARGTHYLPVPSFQAFRSRFVDWWGEQPLGWEVRAYQAVQLVGWAELRTDRGEDVAATLERMRGARFGGLDITLGPDDHTAVEQTTIGLWTVPRPGADVSERDRLPDSFPWVPLARTFSIDGERTDVLPEDWRHLFRGETRQDRPSPRFGRMRFGVTTPRSDPVH
jgi:ABC-type branched-subunit amino acid transport system substrate-binding protein